MKQRTESVIWKTKWQKTPIRTTKRKKDFKNEGRIRDLWDNINHKNICTIGEPEGKEREQGIENLFEEITTENIPNLLKEINRVLEVQRVPNKMNPKRPAPRHTIIKMPNTPSFSRDHLWGGG